MILTLGLLGLTVVLALTLTSAAPATRRSRTRAALRRAAFVRAFPRHANSGDVVSALAREGIGAEAAGPVIEHAAANGIALVTLWRWVDQRGALALDMVQAAAGASRVQPAPEVQRTATAPAPYVPATETQPEPASPTRARVSLSDNVSRDGGRRRHTAA